MNLQPDRTLLKKFAKAIYYFSELLTLSIRSPMHELLSEIQLELLHQTATPVAFQLVVANALMELSP